MNIKKILLISIIAIAVVTSVTTVSAGLFDSLLGNHTQDNAIELDEITFNTTNVTKFKIFYESDESGAHERCYIDENDTGYTINVVNCSKEDNSTFMEFLNEYEEELANCSSQTVDGVTVYNMIANSGDHIGERRFVASVVNKDINTIVDISSPDADETAKIASTLRFK